MTAETIRTELAQQWRHYSHRLPEQWWQWLIAPLIFLQQFVLYWPFPPTHRFNPDPATFMYGGNLLARGYAPYLYMWDIKPPGIYDTMALLSLVIHNPMQQYYAASILTSVMGAGTIMLAALLVYRLSRSNVAAIATGLTIFAYPYFIRVPISGIYTKYFALCFGFLSIYLMLEHRFVLAGVVSTLAPGYWQFGAIFPVIVLIGAWHHRATLWKVVLGMIGTTAVIVAPIVALGGLQAMIEQPLLHPLQMTESGQGLLGRIQKFKRIVSYSWPVYYGGIFCSIYYLTQRRDAWWMGLGLGWSLLQIGRLDFDASPDPFMLVVFVAIGLGLFIGSLNRRQQLALTFIIATVFAGQLYPHRKVFLNDKSTKPDMENPQTNHFMNERYPPSTCLMSKGGISFERRLSGKGLPATCNGVTLAGR